MTQSYTSSYLANSGGILNSIQIFDESHFNSRMSYVNVGKIKPWQNIYIISYLVDYGLSIGMDL